MAAIDKDPKKYWQEINMGTIHAAPNASLFRMLGSCGFDFVDKRVLEIGFFRGADLSEAQRRGAEIYGVDISDAAVSMMQRKFGHTRFVRADLGAEPIRFGVKFDLIFALDMIYYLTNDELGAMARHCFEALLPAGRLVIQFIQSDMVRPVIPRGAQPVGCEEWEHLNDSFAAGNPIRILDSEALVEIFEKPGARLVGRKTVMETYGLEEQQLRCTRFLMFEKTDGVDGRRDR